MPKLEIKNISKTYKKGTVKALVDLHVLGTPPAFVLSQDQTLNKMVS